MIRPTLFERMSNPLKLDEMRRHSARRDEAAAIAHKIVDAGKLPPKGDRS